MSDLTDSTRNPDKNIIKESITAYWNRRAESFAGIRAEEVQSYKADLWREELRAQLPGERLRILDAGCGTGFFEMLLAPMGHRVIGIDLTEGMIEEGKRLLAEQNCSGAELLIMDAENTAFPDGTFDAVISRNLTWNLPDPENAYADWYRVLRPGGVLLNYDAEYAKGFHRFDQSENLAHRDVDSELIEECHRIYHMLEVSAFNRPEWDEAVLKKTGFRNIETDTGAGDRFYGIKDKFYMPDRIFRIRAVK